VIGAVSALVADKVAKKLSARAKKWAEGIKNNPEKIQKLEALLRDKFKVSKANIRKFKETLGLDTELDKILTTLKNKVPANQWEQFKNDFGTKYSDLIEFNSKPDLLQLWSKMVKSQKKVEGNLEYVTGDMKKRYEKLFENRQNNLTLQNLADFVKRFEVLETIGDFRKKYHKLVGKDFVENLKGANLAFAEYTFKNPKTGMTENINLIATSGRKIDNSLNVKEIDGYSLVPNPPSKNELRYFKYTIDKRASDSEAKMFESLGKYLHKNFNIDVRTPEGRDVLKSLNINVNLTSEMSPCNSCSDIIYKQFESISLSKVLVKFGLDFK